MRKLGQIIIGILIILIISTTLCFDNPGDDQPTNEEWWDLEKFNNFLYGNFTVTKKVDSGSEILQKISEPAERLYIAVGIDREYTNLEAEALHNFVKTGGNLIVASDNASTVNVLSKKFGITYSKHSIIYKFEEIDYNYTFLPIELTTINNTFLILMHSPKALQFEDSNNIQSLAKTKSEPNRVISVIDKNSNGHIDNVEQPGPFSVIVEVTVNEGRAIFISDAGMFSDNLWNIISKDPDFMGRLYQNEEFIVDLVYEMYPDDGEIIYDLSTQEAGFSNFHPYPVD